MLRTCAVRLGIAICSLMLILAGCTSPQAVIPPEDATEGLQRELDEVKGLLDQKDQIIKQQALQIEKLNQLVLEINQKEDPRLVTHPNTSMKEVLNQYPRLTPFLDEELLNKCHKVVITATDAQGNQIEAIIEDRQMIKAIPAPIILGLIDDAASETKITEGIDRTYHYELFCEGYSMDFDVVAAGIIEIEGIPWRFKADPDFMMSAIAFLREQKKDETLYTRMYNSGLVQYKDKNYDDCYYDAEKAKKITTAFFKNDKISITEPEALADVAASFTFHYLGDVIILTCYDHFVQLSYDGKTEWYQMEPVAIYQLSSVILSD